jgi:hypothetical protein
MDDGDYRPDRAIASYSRVIRIYANKKNIERVLLTFDPNPSHGLCRPGHCYDFISKRDCWDCCSIDIPQQPFSLPRNFDAEF